MKLKTEPNFHWGARLSLLAGACLVSCSEARPPVAWQEVTERKPAAIVECLENSRDFKAVSKFSGLRGPIESDTYKLGDQFQIAFSSNATTGTMVTVRSDRKLSETELATLYRCTDRN